jgi:hypothetical protein
MSPIDPPFAIDDYFRIARRPLRMMGGPLPVAPFQLPSGRPTGQSVFIALTSNVLL